MSIARLTTFAVGYSRAMDATAAMAQDPTLIQDPARLAQYQQKMMYAQQSYTLTARAIQDINNEDKILAEMLRDA